MATDVTSPSLRRALLVWLLAPLLIVLPAGAGLQYWLLQTPAEAAFDRSLADSVLVLANLIRDEGGLVSVDMSPDTERSLRTDQFDRVYLAVYGPQGRLLVGDDVLRPLLQPLSPGNSDTREIVIAGERVRVFTQAMSCGRAVCQVMVGETLNKRRRLQRDALLAMGISMVALLIGAGLVLWFGIGRSLRPMVALDDQLGRRTLEDLRPLDAPGAPREVLPLIDALNRLFDRLRAAAQAQQAFLADAAHQLRTPLTALRTEAELALLEPHADSIHPTLQRLSQTADRAARLANQLLSLARTEATAQVAARAEPIDLKQIATEAAEEWVPRALAAKVDLGFDLQPATSFGRPFLVRELLGNLLHNALEYAGAGARVTVRTGVENGQAVLEVEDNGPGIPAAARTRVFERFYRLPDSPGQGSGLGLAIVRDIAASHGAHVELLDGSTGTGLRVRVSFPLPA